MIRINLLPHKKKKSKAAPVEGEQAVGVGFGILLASLALVFFFVHSPLSGDIEDQQKRNSKLAKENKQDQNAIKDFDQRKAAFAAAKQQSAAIDELNNARATPANLLFELLTILRKGGQPTVSAAMAEKIAQNENLLWQDDWDPGHLWIESLKESKGDFILMGSAQSGGDVTQLTHRLAASAYFQNVQPEGSAKGKTGKDGSTIYSFKITGRVSY